MNLIPAENQGIVVIITVTVRPENQQALVEALGEVEEIGKSPGLVSRTFLRSLDGTQVITHMHWASKEAYEEARSSIPDFQEIRAKVHHFMDEVVSNSYEVVSAH